MKSIFLVGVVLGLMAFQLGCSQSLPEEPSAYVRSVLDEVSGGDLGVLWDALPETYQGDVVRVAQGHIAAIDGEVYDAVVETLAKIETMATSQREHIVNYAVNEGAARDDVEQAWPHVVGIFKEFRESELGSHETAVEVNLGRLLSRHGSSIIRHVDAIATLAGESFLSDFKTVEVSTLSHEGEAARLRIKSGDGSIEELDVVRVFKRWLPRELVDTWEVTLEEFSSGGEELAQSLAKVKPQVMGFLAMLNVNIDEIASTETQEAFDRAVEEVGEGLISLPFLMVVGALLEGF